MINQALCKPDHIWGVERELILTSLLTVVTIVFLSMTLEMTILGIALWIVTYNGLRMMAAADPIMSRIYLRHIKYRAYYPARSTPWAETKKTFKGW